ncbi:MAG: hypothetical protein ACLFVW_07790, partial [Phycisphaerae bacterium]
MTDCPQQLTFDFHRRKAVVADFDCGLISFYPGLLTLRQIDQHLGLSVAVIARRAGCVVSLREGRTTAVG